MQSLTLKWTVDASPAVRLLLREIAACPPPELEGLRSRHWRMQRREVCGRYLFDYSTDLARFMSNPTCDRAVTQIANYTGTTSPEVTTVEEIPCLDGIERPVFIISAPRSGSTLLYELLAQSSNLWTVGAESEGIIEGIPRLHPANRGFDSHRLTDTDVDLEIMRVLRAGFVADLRNCSGCRVLDLPASERPCRVRLLEKTPENSLRVSFLAAAFPDARFVFLHRDARQCVSSILEGWHHDGFINIPALPEWHRGRWHFLLPEGWRALNDASLLEIAAFQWNAANQRALDDLEAVPHEQWVSVDYDELVAAPERVARRICQVADIEIDEHFAAVLARPLPVSSTAISPPSSIKWKSNPEFHELALDRFTLVRARLRELDRKPAPPPPRREWKTRVSFSCFLDEVRPSPLRERTELIVNPSFHFQLGTTVPLPLLGRTRFRERFLENFPLLWVEDAQARILLPFWVQRKQVSLFRQFVAGLPPPPLSNELAGRLAEIAILESPIPFERRRCNGETFVKRASSRFTEQGYCELPSLIPLVYVAALARYYRTLIESGAWALGDEQVRLRHGWHNESVSRYFHHQFTDFVGRIAGEPVKPSYAYVSAYHEGAVLRPHVDRKQCVFTMSLAIEDVDGSEKAAWPLWFQTHSGRVSLEQRAGDGVLFRGCDLPHWRDVPPAGRESTTLLFHYVPRDFIGVLD